MVEVEFREDGRERLIKLDTPEGVQDYGDRLLEEADPRAKPFDHAYSWKKHVHPFEGKMSDVTETIKVQSSGEGKCTLGWVIHGKVAPDFKEHVEKLAGGAVEAICSGVVERFNH